MFSSNVTFSHEQYMVTGVLGRGGMGVVLKCLDRKLGKDVAVKVLGWNFTNEEVVRFDTEAKTLAKLTHPNIVKVLNFGHSEDDSLFIAMELLEGRILSDLLAEEQKISFEDSLKIFIQLCDGLAHAHSKGILHRDIKPSNMFVARNYNGEVLVTITDFGLAKLLNEDQRLTRTGIGVGSPPYMSPEQADGKPVDERADIYSIGCLMYEVLIGESPFLAITVPQMLMQHIHEQPKKLREKAPDRNFPEEIEAIIDKCLSKSPKDRYQSVVELKNDLQSLKEDLKDTFAYGGGLSGVYSRTDAFGAIRRTGAFIKLSIDAIQQRSPSTKISIVILLAMMLIAGGYAIVEWTKKSIINQKVESEFNLADYRADKEQTDSILNNSITTKKDRLDTDKMWINAKKKQNAHLMIEDMLDKFKTVSVHGDWVDLSYSDITDEQLKTLAQIPVRGIRLGNTQITDEGVKNLTQNKSLEELYLEHTKVTDKAVSHLLALPNLSMLSLTDTKVTDHCLYDIAKMGKLNWLCFEDCKGITGATIDRLDNLWDFNFVSLEGTSFKKSNIPKLKNVKVEFITLSDLKLNDHDLEVLGSLHMPNLQTIILNDNPEITDTGLLHLMRVKLLSALHVIRDPRITFPCKERFRREHMPPTMVFDVEPKSSND